jgi:L-threonylcarbamoyladenylate synthase
MAPRDGIAGHWHVAATDAHTYAHDLYATLRSLDRGGFRLLLVESPPEGPEWEAVRDRLQRAATGSGQLDAQSDLSDDVP